MAAVKRHVLSKKPSDRDVGFELVHSCESPLLLLSGHSSVLINQMASLTIPAWDAGLRWLCSEWSRERYFIRTEKQTDQRCSNARFTSPACAWVASCWAAGSQTSSVYKRHPLRLHSGAFIRDGYKPLLILCDTHTIISFEGISAKRTMWYSNWRCSVMGDY